jgi:hypothetical protein
LSVIVRNRSDRTVDQTGCPDPGPTVWTGRALPGTRASLAASHTNTLTHRRDASTGSKSPHRPQRRAMAHSFRQSLCDRLTRSVCLFLVAFGAASPGLVRALASFSVAAGSRKRGRKNQREEVLENRVCSNITNTAKHALASSARRSSGRKGQPRLPRRILRGRAWKPRRRYRLTASTRRFEFTNTAEHDRGRA